LTGEASLGDNIATISLEKARVLALLSIPADASADQARGWVLAFIMRIPSTYSSADIDLICSVHSDDKMLSSWRADGIDGPLT
jgi:hypothetical protein